MVEREDLDAAAAQPWPMPRSMWRTCPDRHRPRTRSLRDHMDLAASCRPYFFAKWVIFSEPFYINHQYGIVADAALLSVI